MEGPLASKVRVGRGAMLHLSAYAVSGLLGYAFTVGVSRRLGYVQLGAYSEALGVMVFVALLTRWGLDVAALHHVASSRAVGEHGTAAGSMRLAFAGSTLLGSLGAVALFLAAPLLASWFDAPHALELLRILAWGVPFYNMMYVGSSALRGEGRIAWAFAPLVAYPLVSVALAGGALVVLHADVVAVAWATVAALVVAGLAAVILLRAELRAPAAPVPLRRFLGFATANLLVQLSNYGIAWVGLLVLGVRASAADAGYFRAAFQSSMLLALVVDGLASLYAPLSSRLLKQGETQQLTELTKSASRVAFLVTGAATLGLVLAPRVALAPFGVNIGPAAAPFAILVLAQTSTAIVGPGVWLLVTSERNRSAVLAVVPCVLLALVASWLLVPTWGILGAAVATGLAVAGRALLQLALVRRDVGIDPLSWPLARGVALFAGLLLVGAGLAAAAPRAQLAVAAAAALAFLAAAPSLLLTRDDRRAAAGLVGARREPLAPREVAADVDGRA